MRVTDEMRMELSPGTSYTSETVAFVVKTPDDLECTDIGVFSPKLTPALELGETGVIERNISLNTEKCLNSETFPSETEIIDRNWIRVSPKNLTNMTPPKFVKGDIVFIGFMDSDIKTPYYSVSTLNYNGHRQTDDVRFFVPSSPEPNVVLTKDNTYFVELNSKSDKQRIIISTNDANGEKCKQYVLLDSKNGVMSLTDGSRSINISYDDDTIVLKNEKNSSIIINKDQIELNAKTIKINAENKLEITTKKMEIDADKTEFNGDKFESDHKDISVKSDKATIDSKREEHKISSLFSVNGSGKTHIDHQKIGLNGETIIRNFVIGNCPNINIPVPKLNGDSGPPGTSLWSTGVGSVPLVRYDTFSSMISMMCTYIDTALMNPFASPPMAAATVLPQLPNAATKQILSK